jgi:hypothetical protein
VILKGLLGEQPQLCERMSLAQLNERSQEQPALTAQDLLHVAALFHRHPTECNNPYTKALANHSSQANPAADITLPAQSLP